MMWIINNVGLPYHFVVIDGFLSNQWMIWDVRIIGVLTTCQNHITTLCHTNVVIDGIVLTVE
ncbi:hypothetical protein [Candidatus Hodgkinia cicadicola]|uniref:hypothetical protein n=1 Tax=Candidatus Hodgkinia cicadicola TaxID=573658 RepID=UPI001788C333